MGSWRRMGAFLGLVPEDEHRDDSEYYSAPEYSGGAGYRVGTTGYGEESSAADGARSRGRGYVEPITQGSLAMQPREELRPAVDSATGARPVTIRLTGFGEARIIGERYRDGASVILDMTDLSDADARRVVDFAAGLAFALRGSIDKVTTKVFMLLPPHADLSAEDRRAFVGSYSAR